MGAFVSSSEEANRKGTTKAWRRKKKFWRAVLREQQKAFAEERGRNSFLTAGRLSRNLGTVEREQEHTLLHPPNRSRNRETGDEERAQTLFRHGCGINVWFFPSRKFQKKNLKERHGKKGTTYAVYRESIALSQGASSALSSLASLGGEAQKEEPLRPFGRRSGSVGKYRTCQKKTVLQWE